MINKSEMPIKNDLQTNQDNIFRKLVDDSRLTGQLSSVDIAEAVGESATDEKN